VLPSAAPAARMEELLVIPEAFDPVLFGVLSAAVEEEAAAAYEAGFSDGLRTAAWQVPDVRGPNEIDDLGPPGTDLEDDGTAGDDGFPLPWSRGQ
jgi:hypothetical protein